MDLNHSKSEVRDGNNWFRFNRCEHLNALNPDMFRDIRKVIESCEKNACINTPVLTGNARAFAAGADIKHMVGKWSLGYKVNRSIESYSTDIGGPFQADDCGRIQSGTPWVVAVKSPWERLVYVWWEHWPVSSMPSKDAMGVATIIERENYGW